MIACNTTVVQWYWIINRLGQKCNGCIPGWSSLPYALWVTVYYHTPISSATKWVVTFEPKSSKCLSLNHWAECRSDGFTTELRGKGLWIDCCTTWFMETSARPLSSTWSFVYITPSTSNWIVLCSHVDSCGVGLTLSSKSAVQADWSSHSWDVRETLPYMARTVT